MCENESMQNSDVKNTTDVKERLTEDTRMIEFDTTALDAEGLEPSARTEIEIEKPGIPIHKDDALVMLDSPDFVIGGDYECPRRVYLVFPQSDRYMPYPIPVVTCLVRFPHESIKRRPLVDWIETSIRYRRNGLASRTLIEIANKVGGLDVNAATPVGKEFIDHIARLRMTHIGVVDGSNYPK